MLFRLRHYYLELLTSGGQVFLLFIGTHIATPLAWRVSLALIALISFLAWLSALRRMRAFVDMPTSLVASAAQGYVELQGKGRALEGLPLLAPLTNKTCLWYRYQVEHRSGDKWIVESHGESSASFLLEDSTGVCLVDPEGAEIYPACCEKWQEENYRYREWLVLEQETVHVIGGFRTLSAGAFDISLAEDVKQLLAEWKQDFPKLLQRFDLDKSGTLDMREWQLARAAARREAEHQRRQNSAASDLHLMGAPDAGQLYLISTLSEEKVAGRYHLWAWVHVAIFLAALAGLTQVNLLLL